MNHFILQVADLTNSEQIAFSEQLCDNQKVPYYQVWPYHPKIMSKNIIPKEMNKTIVCCHGRNCVLTAYACMLVLQKNNKRSQLNTKGL